MNRVDRLAAMLIHLQSKKIVTAQELAQRFGICIRTVYRDIRALEAAGIPLGSEAGVGYCLVEGYHLPPVRFTFEEAGALLLAGKLAGAFADAKTKSNFDSALYKIRTVLGNEDKAFVAEIEEKIGVFDMSGENMPVENSFIKDIQTALYLKNIMEIHYYSPPANQTTVRKIEPVSLGFYENHWHLIAYCHLRHAYRDFRIDRIQNLYLTDQSFSKAHPPLETVIKKMLGAKNLCNVTVRLKKDSNYEIIRNKCIWGLVGEKDLGGRMEIMLLTDSLPVLGRWLLHYGREVEILSPVELQEIMRQYAAEIAGQYLETE